MNWNIELYATENGDEPVTQFLNSLSGKHRAKAIWEIDLLEEHGLSLKMPYVKSIQGERYKGLMELRIQQGNDISRIFYFLPLGNKIVLLHGFIKKDRKTPKKELVTALRYKEDYIRRFGSNG
ncbi:MAG: type II toxin-antitoxin system RelE/ParE family toxin [Lachnospiraceae bacterium]|nr:type II toxin-antitoxin system RelE/ParE family toxin [Lachnospiraceae bacterium]